MVKVQFGNVERMEWYEAIGQVCDRHMEILKQQRQRKFVFGIVLDCRQMEIIKTIRHTTPSFLHYRTGLLPLFTNAGTQAGEGYTLLVRLLKSSPASLGFTPFSFPNLPYLFANDKQTVEIDKVSMLKEGYGKYSSIFIGHDKNTDVVYIIKYGGNLDLLHHEQEMLNKLSHSYIIKLCGSGNLESSYAILLHL